MTVSELISELKSMNPYASVLIGMEQRYGSDFEYEIDRVEESGAVFIMRKEGTQAPLSLNAEDFEEESESVVAD